MKLTALKTFRPKDHKELTIRRGDQFNTDDEQYAGYLIRSGMAAKDEKMLAEHQNKMLKDFENKGLPTKEESPEQRSQGLSEPSDKSETSEERNSGTGIRKQVTNKKAE